MKPVRLTQHAQTRLTRRGTTPEEVETAIYNRPWKPAEGGRLQCHMDVPHRSEWYGKRYETKQVRPIFVEEGDEIVVITIYTYYF